MVISFPIDFRIKYLQDVLNVRAYASEHLKLVNVPLPLKHLMRRDTNIKRYTTEQFNKKLFLLSISFVSFFSIFTNNF